MYPHCICLWSPIRSQTVVPVWSLNGELPSHMLSCDILVYYSQLVKHCRRVQSTLFNRHHVLVDRSTHKTWWCWCATLTYTRLICLKLKLLCLGSSHHPVTLTFIHLPGSFVLYFFQFWRATPRTISLLNWMWKVLIFL